MKKNNELVKKGLAIILALVLTVSLVPDSVIPVNAATGKVKLNKKTVTVSVGKKKTIILKKVKHRVVWKIVYGKKNVSIKKKEKYKHLRFYIKNIGNADVNQLDICATAQKNTMLCDIDEVEFLVDNKFINYSICYDRKILKNDIILIDIAYLENSKICNMFSGEIALIFRDSYDNLYEQPLFIQQRNLYEPRFISYNEFKIYTSTDTALECFKKPWLW